MMAILVRGRENPGDEKQTPVPRGMPTISSGCQEVDAMTALICHAVPHWRTKCHSRKARCASAIRPRRSITLLTDARRFWKTKK